MAPVVSDLQHLFVGHCGELQVAPALHLQHLGDLSVAAAEHAGLVGLQRAVLDAAAGTSAA